jgi:predicted secreted protein
MAEITGMLAKVYAGTAGGTLVTGAHNWTLDDNCDVQETTDYASLGVKDFIAGNVGWSGGFELRYDTTQDPHAVAGANLNPGTTVVLLLYLNATKYYTGSAIIQSITPTVPQAAPITYAVKFQGIGVLDKSNLT